jgi:hypothetical protein
MNQANLHQQALRIASLQLESLASSRPNQWKGIVVDKRSQTAPLFWWNDFIPLHEIHLNDALDRPKGYMIVCTDPRIPPVLEYSDDGNISAFLVASTKQLGHLLNTQKSIERIIFVTSTQLYVEVHLASDELALFDPIAGELHSRRALPIPRLDPAQVFDQRTVGQLWANLALGPSEGLRDYVGSVLPVLYNQNCQGNRLDCEFKLDSSDTVCTPAAIAGCSPVAWAMLASAYKRLGLPQSRAIWPTSTTWEFDWPSTAPSTSQSVEVDRTIWRAHELMGTSAGGATTVGLIFRGQDIFRDFGMDWDFRGSPQYNVADICDKVSHDRPVLWGAQGPWAHYGRTIRGTDGHTVVVYGFREQDHMFLAALGWGGGVGRKYINYLQFTDFYTVMPADNI